MRKAAAKPERNRELARIHILKAQLRLDDESYRNVLWVHGSVTTSAELDGHGRMAVIKHLQAHVDRAAVALAGPAPRSLATKPMLRKIAAQLRSAGRDWHYATAMANRMYSQANLDWCSDQQLRGLIAALDVDAKRKAA